MTVQRLLLSDPLNEGWSGNDFPGLEGVAEYIEQSGLAVLIAAWGAFDV